MYGVECFGTASHIAEVRTFEVRLMRWSVTHWNGDLGRPGTPAHRQLVAFAIGSRVHRAHQGGVQIFRVVSATGDLNRLDSARITAPSLVRG